MWQLTSLAVVALSVDPEVKQTALGGWHLKRRWLTGGLEFNEENVRLLKKLVSLHGRESGSRAENVGDGVGLGGGGRTRTWGGGGRNASLNIGGPEITPNMLCHLLSGFPAAPHTISLQEFKPSSSYHIRD